jgi:cobalt-zinc-cadmium efflux system protein
MNPHPNLEIEKRFILSLSLTAVILVAEVLGGVWTGSLALLSDSAHVFLDLFALCLSFLALRISARSADDAHTYGFHRMEVLAALLNGLTLAAISVGIFYEAWQRWQYPEPVKVPEMLAIAVIGLVMNGIVAFVLGGHSHEQEENAGLAPQREDLNVKSAFLHVLGDAISSVGVILAAILIWRTGWLWVDPLTSLLIGLIIVVSSWRVLKSSVHILVEGVPEGIRLEDVRRAMTAIDGVHEIHDLHVWNICSGHVALSAHITVGDTSQGHIWPLMKDMKEILISRFGIEHTTLQFECNACGQGRSYSPDMTNDGNYGD